MRGQLKSWIAPATAFLFGTLGVLAASCVELKLSPDASAQGDGAPEGGVDSAPRTDANTSSGGANGGRFIGEVTLFAGPFAPKGWALCHGQELLIADNVALFSVIGTTYGGNGQTTFKLPDLRGRVPLQAGQGADLTNRQLGTSGGSENVALTPAELPSHDHALMGSSLLGTQANPQGRVLAEHTGAYNTPTSRAGSMVPLHSSSIAATGNSQPHANMPPFLTLNYIIAVDGPFPQRN